MHHLLRHCTSWDIKFTLSYTGWLYKDCLLSSSKCRDLPESAYHLQIPWKLQLCPPVGAGYPSADQSVHWWCSLVRPEPRPRCWRHHGCSPAWLDPANATIFNFSILKATSLMLSLIFAKVPHIYASEWECILLYKMIWLWRLPTHQQKLTKIPITVKTDSQYACSVGYWFTGYLQQQICPVQWQSSTRAWSRDAQRPSLYDRPCLPHQSAS